MSDKVKEKTFEELVMERVVRFNEFGNHAYGFDINDNSIYHRAIDKDYITYSEYNDDGICIHAKHSNGIEFWYDNSGNMIKEKRMDGNVSYYDIDGNKVYRDKYKNLHNIKSIELSILDKTTRIEKYDKNGKLIYQFDKDYECWEEYNNDGKLIRHKDSKNNIEVYFDGNGNEISEEEFILLYSK